MSKQQILDADDLPRQKETVLEWGCDVWLRTMTGTERDAFEREFVTSRGQSRPMPANIRARLLVLVLCDENGKRLFIDNEADALGKKSGTVLDRLFAIAMRVNGLTDDDVQDLAKNSDSPQGADSGSS